MNVLVVGGGGFIGSHMVKLLAANNHSVTVYDNFCNGHRDAVLVGEIVEADLADSARLDGLFAGNDFDCVMHFASYIEVGESTRLPGKYYANNFCNTMNLLDAMLRHEVRNFIFSSTAAIFGEPQYTPIDEAHPFAPINPYGISKYMVELLLRDYDRAHGMKSVCLRYFNAAGADTEGQLGERHQPESHLIPLVLQAASGRRESISIFGDDYDTPDGTCVRDYIHVQDLCDAHLLALQFLRDGGRSAQFNLGNGQGFSVRQVIDKAAEITGREIPLVLAPRRDGDPAVLVADATLAQQKLGWSPSRSDLAQIIDTAWRWETSFFAQ